MFDCRGSVAESDGGFRQTRLYPSLPIGFYGSAQFSEVKRRGTRVLSGSNATPVASDGDELLIWRSQLSLQKSLFALLQTTEKCHVRNLLLQSIRLRLFLRANVFYEGIGRFLV